MESQVIEKKENSYSYIFKKTFESIFEKKYQLIQALVIPFIFLTILGYFNTPEMMQKLGLATFYVLILISFLITIIMAITIHRVLLLDKSEIPKWGVYKYGSREVSFALKAIGLGLLCFVLIMLLTVGIGAVDMVLKLFLDKATVSIISIIGFTIGFIFLGVIFSRVSLVFPSISIDKKMDFADAIIISKDYKLLVFICVVIIPIVLGAVVGFVYGLAIEFLMGVISQKFSILYSLVDAFITIFIVAFLSTTYQFIISKQPEKVEPELEEVEYTDIENGYKIQIDNRHSITFDEIKDLLLKQYEELGFDFVKLNTDSSWMIKNPDIENAYVLLSKKENYYNIETYNVDKKPIIELN